MVARVKQAEPVRVEVGEHIFYLYPFPAFKANNILGELSSSLLPVLGALAPIMMSGDGLDTDIGKAGPRIANAFASLSGDKVETLLKKLLIQYRNVALDTGEGNKPEWLTEEAANEIFCGEAQDMFVLAAHVIQINYSGFFRKLAGPSGDVMSMLAARMGLSDTES